MPSQSQIEKTVGIDATVATFLMSMQHCSSAAKNAIDLLQMQARAYDPAGFALLEQAVANCKTEMKRLADFKPFDKLNAIIDQHQSAFVRHSVGFQVSQYAGTQNELSPIMKMIDSAKETEAIEKIKFQLKLFGKPSLVMIGNQKSPVYTCEIAGDMMAASPGGGTAILIPNEGGLVKFTGKNSVSVHTIAASIAHDYAVAVMECLQQKQVQYAQEAQGVHQPQSPRMRR